MVFSLNWVLKFFRLELSRKKPPYNTGVFIFQSNEVLEAAKANAWKNKRLTYFIVHCKDRIGWALVVPAWEMEGVVAKHLPKPALYNTCFTVIARRLDQDALKTLEQADGT